MDMHDDLAARLTAAGLDWIVPRWQAPPGVQGFVTTRNGGVSEGAARSLDLGHAAPDANAQRRAAIDENRRRVEAFLPSRPAWLSQVHGADVAVVDADAIARADGGVVARADGAVTRQADVVLAVRVADCLPVLLADRDGTAIGVAHAGWRGLSAGLLENTVAAMRCPPARIAAWLGPAIGRDAFEVGADVHDAFVRSDADAAAAFVAGPPGKWHADLFALAQQRLARAGVHSIDGGGLCTHSDRARFFSFRRDGTSGRMGAFLWRTERLA
jgi:purine-nucleoside/S-methyl-5'-thioadenosine phosphorylase / adenosine deaminase